MKKESKAELAADFRQALEHFVSAGREMLLAGEALLEVGVTMADKFLEEKPPAGSARKAGTAKKVEVELAGVLIKYLVVNSFEPKKPA